MLIRYEWFNFEGRVTLKVKKEMNTICKLSDHMFTPNENVTPSFAKAQECKHIWKSS